MTDLKKTASCVSCLLTDVSPDGAVVLGRLIEPLLQRVLPFSCGHAALMLRAVFSAKRVAEALAEVPAGAQREAAAADIDLPAVGRHLQGILSGTTNGLLRAAAQGLLNLHIYE